MGLNFQIIAAENALIGKHACADLQIPHDTGVAVFAIDIDDIEMSIAQMIADLPAGFANVRGATLDVGKPNVVAQRAVGQFVAQEQVHDTREIRCALIGLDIAEGFQGVDGENTSVTAIESADAMGLGQQGTTDPGSDFQDIDGSGTIAVFFRNLCHQEQHGDMAFDR